MFNFSLKLKAAMERFKQVRTNKSFTTLILIEETFHDIFSPLKFLICMILMLLYPLLLVLAPISVDFGSISIHHASSYIAVVLAFPLFFWTFGIILTSIIGISGSHLISEEVNTGTMLILISKPIKRYKIFVGKYIALFLHGLFLSFTALLLIGVISVLRYSGNIHHFIGITPFLISVFLYSVVLTFIFVSITLSFSSIFKSPRNSSISIIFLILISFIGFMVLRELIHVDYQNLQLYHFDLGYHLANVYVLFIELFNAIPPSIGWQSTFAQLYSVFSYLGIVDPDQNINLGGLQKTNYYLPLVSLLIWVSIAILLLTYGVLSIQRREISS